MHRTALAGSALTWKWDAVAAIVGLLVLADLGAPVQAQEDPSKTTRYLAWELGNQISMAALGYDQGASMDLVSRMIDRVRPAAEYFGATIPPLPAKTGQKAEDSARVLDYLLNSVWDSIGSRIQSKHPGDHSLLFEIAVKANILLLMYTPGDDIGHAIAEVISNRAPRAGIPYNTWRPLVSEIEQGGPYDAVKAAVVRLHEDMTVLLGPAQ